MPERVDIAVVGGGAAGLVAAISAARRGASVTVLERLPRPGKKLLATGGGRGNLLNEGLAASSFTATDPRLVASVLERFGADEIRVFFEGLGLRLQTDDAGRVYPATNQASSILKVLEIELARLGVRLMPGFEAADLAVTAKGFEVRSAEGMKAAAGAVILAGGGRSYPALGSDGSCYALAARFGHRLVQPVPSAVPLLVRDPLCHLLQGQRMRARVAGFVDGRAVGAANGELLFTQYGLSGTAVLDVSEPLSIGLNRDKTNDAAVVVDLVPFMTEHELAAELARRGEAGWPQGDLVTGILPEKFRLALPQVLRESGTAAGNNRPVRSFQSAAAALKARTFAVHGTRGWNEAEFTAGGVDAAELRPRTLESKLQRGLYFAGEVLDVQGGRGGFNLGWAWSSGYVAGLTE